MAINIKATEAEIKEAQKAKEEEELKAQIEVYEGQSYESREKYQEVKQKRSTARSKLPKDVPTDASYKEQDLQAQYIQANVVSPNQEKQVKEYRAEIKKQQTASEKVQVLDKELPQLYTKAVEEVESVKTGVTQAKQKVADKYDSVIQTKTTLLETEKARRAKQFADAEKAHQETLAKNPYTEANRSIESAKHQSRHFSPLKFNYEWGKANERYHRQANITNQEAMKNIRLEHYTADGFAFVEAGALQRDAGQLMGDIAMGRGMNYRNISAKGRYQVELVMAKRSLLASGNEKQYFESVAKTQKKYKKYEQQQSEMRSAQARAKVAGYLKADSEHWAKVASNPYTSNPNATTPNFTVGSGTKDDPFRTNYNKGKTAVGETTTPPKDMLAYYIQDYQKQSKTYNKANTGLENTNYSQADLQQINKQRENELANARQTQHVAELRAGNIGLADALMNPQTTQSYTGVSTVNLKTFLKERGYDLSKPEAIPNSVLTTPVKYDKARETAFDSVKFDTPMGDLRTKEPYYAGFSVSDGKMAWNYKYPLASKEVIQQRMEAKQRIAKFDPLTPAVQRKEGTKTGVKFTNLKDPIVGKTDSSKPLEQKGVSAFGITPTQSAQDMVYDYTVPSNQKSVFPLMSGQTFEASTPVTFDTQKEAEDYVKSKPKEKVFSGTDNPAWNRLMYAPAVYTGELPDPRETPDWKDDARLYGSTMLSPLVNVASSVVNLTQPEDKQIPIYRTGSDVLIGDTIKDFEEGQPLRGSGVTGLGKYIEKDPVRAGLELPAEAVMWIGGGWAVSGTVRGATTGVRIAGQVGSKIVQSNAPMIVKVPTMAVMGAGSAVKTGAQFVATVPRRTGVAVGSQVWKQLPENVQGGLRKTDRALFEMQGTRQGVTITNPRIGLRQKLYYTANPFGRRFLDKAREEGIKRNPFVEAESAVIGKGTDFTKLGITKPIPETATAKELSKTAVNKWELGLATPDWRGVQKVNIKSGTKSGGSAPEIKPMKVEDIREVNIGQINLKSGVPDPMPSGSSPLSGGRTPAEDVMNQLAKQKKPTEIPLKEVSDGKIKNTSPEVEILSKDKILIPVKDNPDFNTLVLKKGKTTQNPEYKRAKVGTGITTPAFGKIPFFSNIRYSKDGIFSGARFGSRQSIQKPSMPDAKNWVKRTTDNTKRMLKQAEEKGFSSLLNKDNITYKVAKKKQTADDILDKKLNDFRSVKDNFDADSELKLKLFKQQVKLKQEEKIKGIIKSPKLDRISKQAREQNKQSISAKLNVQKAILKQKITSSKQGVKTKLDPSRKYEVDIIRTTDDSTAKRTIVEAKGDEVIGKSYTPIESKWFGSKTPVQTTEEVVKPKVISEKLVYTDTGKPVKTPQTYRGRIGTLFEGEVTPQTTGRFTQGEIISAPLKDLDNITSDIVTVSKKGEYKTLKGTVKPTITSVKVIDEESVIASRLEKFPITKETAKASPDEIQTNIKTKLTELPREKIPDGIDYREVGKINIKSGTQNPLASGKQDPMIKAQSKFDDDMPFEAKPTGATTNALLIKPKLGESIAKPSADKVKGIYKKASKSTESPYTYSSKLYSPAVGSIMYTSSTIKPVEGIESKTNIDTGVKIETNIQGKIDTKVETGLKQESVQKTLSDQLTKVQSRSDLGSKVKPSIKLDSVQKLGTKQTTAQAPLLEIPIKQRTKPKGGLVWIPTVDLEDKPAKRGKRGKKKGFIGNVRLDNIMGMYKRKEITYGQKKVTKLERLDMRLTSKTPNRISQPSSKLL